MTFLRTIALTMIIASIAGCASSGSGSDSGKPLTPAQQLVKAPWACETMLGQGAFLNTDITYKADGTAAFALTVSGQMGPMNAEGKGEGVGTWKLLDGDKQLEQTITTAKLTSAKLNGGDVPADMAQGLTKSLIGQTQTAMLTLSDTSMELVTVGDGQKTTCKR